MGVQQAEPKTLDDITVRVTQLPVGKARNLLVRIGKIVGPAIGAGLRGLDAKEDGNVNLADLKVSALGDLLTVFFEKVDDETLAYMEGIFVETTELGLGDDRWVPLRTEFALLFRGRMELYFRWMGHCLEVNYADFFSGLKGGGLGALQGLMRTGPLSNSRRTSTGKSGE